MNRRTPLVLLSALIALAGAVAAYAYVRTADARALAGKRVRQVVVAEKRIPAGLDARALTAGGYVRTVPMPAQTVPDDALDSVGQVAAGRVVTAQIQRGQLLLSAMFGDRESGSIPDGMVAVAARVTADAFGPGRVGKGSRVAIFYTYSAVDDAHRNVVSGAGLERDRAATHVTRLLMSGVEVLGIDPIAGGGASGSGADGGSGSGSGRESGSSSEGNSGGGGGGGGEVTVTFALSQQDAERLAHAVAVGGALNIALLGGSSNVSPNPGVDNRTLFP